MLPVVFGDKADFASLRPVRAQALASALAEDMVPGARLVAVHRRPGHSTLHVKLDVGVSQLSARDIRATEAVAISFSDDDEAWPEVYALRPDFPRDAPHLTYNEPDFPVGLCISEEHFDDAKVHWTTPRFIRHLQSWFERTAEDALHADDQGLDPVMLRRDGELIVPHRLMTSTVPVPVQAYQLADSKVFFLQNLGAPENQMKPEFACARLLAPARQHGVLFLQLPSTLKEFIDRLEACEWEGCGAEIRKKVIEWRDAKLGHLKPMFLVTFPLLRNKGDEEPETYNTWAIASPSTIEDVAIDLGIVVRAQGFTAPLIGSQIPQDTTAGEMTPLWHLNPRTSLSPATAAVYNCLATPPSLRTVVIGAGALGSQVLANAMKAGFLPTHIVDVDRLMPHNIARHVLGREAVGWEKAMAMKLVAAATLDSETLPEAIVADILRPGDKGTVLLEALCAAELVVDLSASVAVSGALASDERYGAPRVSMFLNQSGTDLVVLAEDADRTIPLDHVEAQYYWAVATDSSLLGHLQSNDPIRYGRSCRDLSGRIAQSHVATLSGIASEMLLRAASGHGLPPAAIWRCDPDTMTISRIAPSIEPIKTVQAGSWTVHIAQSLIRDVATMRVARLPVETGGCLVGTWNTERGVIQLVGALPAPPDSDETPASFVRGIVGQEAAMAAITEKTAGMLGYVGEWHSHPRWASTMPSSDDVALYGWVNQHMEDEGYPAAMLIIGEGGAFTLVISGSPPMPLGTL